MQKSKGGKVLREFFVYFSSMMFGDAIMTVVVRSCLIYHHLAELIRFVKALNGTTNAAAIR